MTQPNDKPMPDLLPCDAGKLKELYAEGNFRDDIQEALFRAIKIVERHNTRANSAALQGDKNISINLKRLNKVIEDFFAGEIQTESGFLMIAKAAKNYLSLAQQPTSEARAAALNWFNGVVKTMSKAAGTDENIPPVETIRSALQQPDNGELVEALEFYARPQMIYKDDSWLTGIIKDCKATTEYQADMGQLATKALAKYKAKAQG